MLNIDDISQDHAVISFIMAGEEIWAELSLSHTCERMCGDNYTNEYFWDEYTPIITGMQGLDDDGEYYPMPSEMAEMIKKLINCDEFYTAYQEQFDDNFKWGERTTRYYYTA